MNKYILSSLIVLCASTIVTMEREGGNNSRIRSVTTNDLARESLEAVVFSSELPALSRDFCDHVVACAPESIKRKTLLLTNPKIRAKLMIDSIVMHGPTGSGKTTLGQVIMQEIGAPFLFVRGSMLGNEYANSRSAGIRRIGQIIKEKKYNLMIDEIDSLTTYKSKQNGKKSEVEDDAPKALWQLIDQMRRDRLLLIGTTNCLKNMPLPLQGRLEGCIYEVPLILSLSSFMEKIVKFHLQDKAIESQLVIVKLCKSVKAVSNRQLLKVIELAYENSVERDQNNPVITQNDVSVAVNQILQDRKSFAKTQWSKKEIFQYSTQTIIALSSLIGIVNMGWSFYNAQRSLRLSEMGLENQIESMNLQRQGLDLQNSSLVLQTQGLALQERGIQMQELASQVQRDAFWYQKWASNYISIAAAIIGDVKDYATLPDSKEKTYTHQFLSAASEATRSSNPTSIISSPMNHIGQLSALIDRSVKSYGYWIGNASKSSALYVWRKIW